MYRNFFKLEEKPFNLTPDPRFLYLNSNHREVLASLKYGILEKRGFVVVTGEVGTGKTTHLFNFLEQLGEKTVSAFIFNPILTQEEFFQYIFEDFGLPPGSKTKTDFLIGLNKFLLEQADKGVTTVLVIDEAQKMSSEILEEVRLLSNLETTREKLLADRPGGAAGTGCKAAIAVAAAIAAADFHPRPDFTALRQGNRAVYPSPPEGGRLCRGG